MKFQVTGCDGEQIVFLDNVVLAAVKQPLVCLGKLLKGNWALGTTGDGMCLERAGMAFPVHWSKNSLAAFMKIYKITEDEAPTVTPSREASVRMVVEVSEELQMHLDSPGWSLNSDTRPVHFAMKESETVDPSLKFSPEEWPYRTTLLHRGNRRYELFECGEEWSLRRRIPFGKEERVGTLLSRTPLDPGEVGKPVPGSGDVKVPRHTVKDLRTACRSLHVSKNGAKALVWARLKKEVAMLRLKTSVECSDAVKAEYEREPVAQSLPTKPSPDLVALHEITHIPRQDWCESCAAARSREDVFSSSGDPGRREYPTVSMDWMFTSTAEGPLATHLIAVDSQTKFVIVIPVEGKGGKSLSYATEEIVRFSSSLGHSRMVLRHDTEPAMIQLAKSVKDTRLRMGLATDEEPVAPESSAHGALRLSATSIR